MTGNKLSVSSNRNACTCCRDEAPKTIQELPPGLHAFYRRIFDQLRYGESVVVGRCLRYAKLKKEEMRWEVDELRERVVLSTRIFNALASKQHVPEILQGLEERQDLSTIAFSTASPTRLKLGTNSRFEAFEVTEATETTNRMEKRGETEKMKAIDGIETTVTLEESLDNPKYNNFYVYAITGSQ